MENASKALIIAGAILISIILITIGILVVRSAGGVTDRASSVMDQQDIEIFNSPFMDYEGENKRGSDVRDLLGKVTSSNANSAEQVSVTYRGNGSKDLSRNRCD